MYYVLFFWSSDFCPMFCVSFVRLMSPVWRQWVSEGLWDWHTHWAGDGGSLHNFSLLQFVNPLPSLWPGQHKQLNTRIQFKFILYLFYANSILQTTLLLKSTAIVHLLFVLLESICGGGCIFCKVWPLIPHLAQSEYSQLRRGGSISAQLPWSHDETTQEYSVL